MRAKFDDYLVDGTPILMPDQGISISRTDLDSEDSGRDESGVMHRIIVRPRVRTWSLSYSHLTKAEYDYMNDLLYGKPDFVFTVDGEEVQAYCSNDSISYWNAKTKEYKNLKFNIIEC